MSDPTPRPVPLEQTRERIIDQLCQHYAVENLTDDMLEQRLAQAIAATSLVELNALVADLPTETASASGSTSSAPSASVALARPENVPERQVVLAVMGGAERKGAWTPPRHLHVVAVMGGAELDFRDARFGPGVTEVTCFALMGGIELIVPPGVQVETNGLALMGGFGHAGNTPQAAGPDAPVLRIGGVAIMGGVDLDVRYPGERRGEARKRERIDRAEKAAARRLKRGK
ncbi:MAG TPA: DUF1707 domain-containing protein [Longimicrobium sp.]|nr:DUF1707 domain-containing protein [Longimicrobium sp.]